VKIEPNIMILDIIFDATDAIANIIKELKPSNPSDIPKSAKQIHQVIGRFVPFLMRNPREAHILY